MSLVGAIVTGVVVSTLGHAGGKTKGGGGVADAVNGAVLAAASLPSLLETCKTCLVVLASNLCLSFRGLHQKLFRATPQGGKDSVDDTLLQYEMRQIGLVMFVVPAFILDAPSVLARIWEISAEVGLFRSSILIRYLGLSVINGVAFTSYNLASTFVLTRISVVHHAALNCIR